MGSPILLAGCGKMGAALVAGWLGEMLSPSDIVIVEPHAETAASLRARFGVTVHPDADAAALDAAVRPGAVIFAVKPQMLDEVAPHYARFASSRCVFMSIAAGRTIAGLGRHLGADAAIVRTMPNTPAAVGRGATVACANDRTTPDQRRLCERLLAAVGTVDWVEDEALLDAVTAVSGSGPAYVFLLVECLAAAGVEAGLPADLAGRLARETVAGAGELLHRAEEPAQTLRVNVTSPGGTTAAALSVLMADNALAALLASAVRAAAERSRQLAG